MANSRKLHLTDFAERVAAQIAPKLPAQSSILVGLSGGMDSVVLLHLLHALSGRFSWQISALHVHHGISPNADAWSEFCIDLCNRLNVFLHVERVNIAPLRKHGIEAAARKLRHASFAAQDCDFVALAHHADDQVETLLLQLLRGAGVRGASAMAQFSERADDVQLVRPLLQCSRQEILDYAASNDLQWIEDESNSDDAYPRNFLRHRVLPIMKKRFPAYRETLFRSTQHLAEASGLLDELAQLDARQAIRANTISVEVLRSLSMPRSKNLLRYFFHQNETPMPETIQLEEILHQLLHSRKDGALCVNFSHWQIRLFQGKAYVFKTPGEFERRQVMIWNGEKQLVWPALDMPINFDHVLGAGISLEKLLRGRVTLRLRHGGEVLRPFRNAATRTLKNLLQEHHVPPWQRERLPLLFCDEDLVCVPNLVIAADYLALPEETGIKVSCKF